MAKKIENKSGTNLISRREFLVGSGALIATISLAACTSQATTPLSTNVTPTLSQKTSNPTSTTSTITPKYGGTLKSIWLSAESNIGWPVEMSMGNSATIVQVCLETLLRGDNKGNLYPWLAESYKIDDGLKFITFNLRKGVKFHDGNDFNANVAKWNLDNYIDAKAESNWASVDILSDYVIRVNFTEWNNTLPVSFGDAPTVTAYMVSKTAFDKNGIDWMRQNPVGTGPFKFESFQLDVGMKLVKNNDYWLKGKPYLDRMEYTFIVDPVTRKMNAIDTDTSIISTAKEAADMEALGLTTKTLISANQVLVPDTANADSPWANMKVREAVEYAIDREAIAKAFGHGYLQAPYQIPPRYSLAYDSNFTLGRKTDTGKAKQLLAEGGVPDGFKTTIIVCPGVDRDIPTALQADLAKIGIQADLDFPEVGKWATYTGLVHGLKMLPSIFPYLLWT